MVLIPQFYHPWCGQCLWHLILLSLNLCDSIYTFLKNLNTFVGQFPIMISLRVLSFCRRFRTSTNIESLRCLSQSPVSSTSPDFAEPAPATIKPETFAHMLRHSKFVQIGDPVGKVSKATLGPVLAASICKEYTFFKHVRRRPKNLLSV